MESLNVNRTLTPVELHEKVSEFLDGLSLDLTIQAHRIFVGDMMLTQVKMLTLESPETLPKANARPNVINPVGDEPMQDEIIGSTRNTLTNVSEDEIKDDNVQRLEDIGREPIESPATVVEHEEDQETEQREDPTDPALAVRKQLTDLFESNTDYFYDDKAVFSRGKCLVDMGIAVLGKYLETKDASVPITCEYYKAHKTDVLTVKDCRSGAVYIYINKEIVSYIFDYLSFICAVECAIGVSSWEEWIDRVPNGGCSNQKIVLDDFLTVKERLNDIFRPRYVGNSNQTSKGHSDDSLSVKPKRNRRKR